MSAYLAVTALDGLVASGCVGLGIAICAIMFPRLALLAQAALVAKLILHTLFLVQMFVFPGVEGRIVWDALHLALVALYAFSRVVGDGPMEVLDWSFIVWAFLGHSADLLARLLIPWVVVPALFEQYLASLDGDAFRDQAKDQSRDARRRGLAVWCSRLWARLRRHRGHGGRTEQHLLGDIEGQI